MFVFNKVNKALGKNFNGFGNRQSFFDSLPFLKQNIATEKPKPNEDIMTFRLLTKGFIEKQNHKV